MGKKGLILSAVLLLVVSAAAQASPTTICDFESFDTSRCSSGYLRAWACNGLDTVSWSHSNPFDRIGDYWVTNDAGEYIVNPCIQSATLTINVCGLNPADDHAGILFTDREGVEHRFWQDYGLLTNGDNVYTLEREWLNGVDVLGGIRYTRDGFCDWSDSIRINWSRLCVTYDCAVVPVPGAFVLGTLGLGVVGYMRRRKVI